MRVRELTPTSVSGPSWYTAFSVAAKKAARFGAIIATYIKDLPEIYNRFVVQRNKAWISKIEDLVVNGDTALVVVGAGHFVGPDNLLELLMDKDYTIEQMNQELEFSKAEIDKRIT